MGPLHTASPKGLVYHAFFAGVVELRSVMVEEQERVDLRQIRPGQRTSRDEIADVVAERGMNLSNATHGAPSKIDRDAVLHPIAVARRAEWFVALACGRRGRKFIAPVLGLGELGGSSGRSFGHQMEMGRVAPQINRG